MEINEVRNLLRTVKWLSENWFGVLRMDYSRAFAACLYAKRAEPILAVGGKVATGFSVSAYSLVLRLGADALESKRLADEVFNGVQSIRMDDGFIRPFYGAALCLGADRAGVFEYQVDFEIFMEGE